MANLPLWEDETKAGSLFPRAQPIPVKHIVVPSVKGDRSLLTVDAFRAGQDALATERKRARQRAETPEMREARWQAAKAQVRAEISMERRQERVAAGIEVHSPLADMEAWLGRHFDVLTHVDAHLTLRCDVFDATVASLSQVTQAMQ